MNHFLNKDNTTYLKGISMSMIIIHHLYQYLIGVYGLQRMWWCDIPLQNLGYLATGVFFLLSGYGIFMSSKLNAHNDVNHGLRRCLRLYTPFVYVCVIEIIYRLVADMPINLLKIPVLSLMSSNLWFLKVIMGLYLLVYVVMSVFTESRARMVVTFFIVGTYIMVAQYFGLDTYYYNSILCFPIGMLVASIKQTPTRIYLMSVAGVLVFCISFTLPMITDSFVLKELGMIVSCVAFSLLMLVFAPIRFARSVFAYVGVNSLIIYIAQMFLLAYVRPSLPIHFVLIVVSLLIIITSSYICVSKIRFCKKVVVCK